MKRIMYLIAIAFLLLAAPAYSAQVQNITVYFDKDKAVVNPAELQKLQALKAADMVLLQGHTDEEGSETYNMTLSKRRVEAIKAVIANLDPAIKTEAINYGESKPIAGNKDEAQKQLNRRVEISWISDPMLRIKTPVQFYEIDATKANTVTCREGTKIEIPADAFTVKKVLLKVSEYYNAASILSANLGTRCDGKPIESAGMIYITAEANGQSVEPNQPLKFKFPRNNKNKDFKIFAGERNANFEMNWKLSASKLATPTPVPTMRETSLDTSNFIIQSSDNYYTSTITGDVFGQLDSFWVKLAQKDKRNMMSNGCMQDAVVDINVDKDGRIVEVKTNYRDKYTACDREVQKYMRDCLPKRFKPLQWFSNIHMMFDSTVVRYSSTIAVSRSWGAAPQGDFIADYETDKIVLASAKMGWINCDRFLNNPVIDYTVQAESDANVRLVMKKYKSFFTNNYDENAEATVKAKKAGNFIFKKIPANEEVTIISTRKVNGKIMLAIADAKTGANGVFAKLNYKEVTQKELEEAMKSLTI